MYDTQEIYLSQLEPYEDTREKCPYCHGHHTRFVDFDYTNIDDLTHEKHFCLTHEKHFCLFCEVDFTIAYEIAY